jgi:hypothetical protein
VVHDLRSHSFHHALASLAVSAEDLPHHLAVEAAHELRGRAAVRDTKILNGSSVVMQLPGVPLASSPGRERALHLCEARWRHEPLQGRRVTSSKC